MGTLSYQPQVELFCLKVAQEEGLIFGLKATFTGLPAGSRVSVQLLRHGAWVGVSLLDTIVGDWGMVEVDFHSVLGTSYYLNDAILRVVGPNQRWVYFVRPTCLTGIRLLLWFLNPRNWRWKQDTDYFVHGLPDD